jgi:phosphatidylglycerol---prolipoprotein diacylglyceryl transferase
MRREVARRSGGGISVAVDDRRAYAENISWPWCCSLGRLLIPYFRQPALHFGPFTVHAFGVLVGCGIILGTTVLQRRAWERRLSHAEVARFISWILVGGFLGAHLFDRLAYFPLETLADPLSLLRFWEGLSSFGGFLGGTVGGFLFFVKHARPGTAWIFADCFAYAFPFGWIFGRLGCFVAYDHPGSATQFVLGQTYKDGVVRHNLGLDEALYSFAVALLFFFLRRKRRCDGFYLGLFLVLYAPFRFAVDYLRIVDVRYAGLTPGQYGSVLLLLVGGAILVHRRDRGEAPVR